MKKMREDGIVNIQIAQSGQFRSVPVVKCQRFNNAVQGNEDVVRIDSGAPL